MCNTTLQHPYSQVALAGVQPPAPSMDQLQLQPNPFLPFPFSEQGRLSGQPWVLLQLYTLPSTKDMSIMAEEMLSKSQGLA